VSGGSTVSRTRSADRGLAHDLRNLLTAIGGHAQLAYDALPADHPAREDLEEVLAAASRAHQLAEAWLAGAGSGAVVGPPTPLDDLVRGSVPLLRAVAGPGITLRLELAAPLPVRISRLRIERILLNLCLNARDAMDGAGLIRLVTGERPDGRLEVAVIDDGPGIPDAVLRRVAQADAEPTASSDGHGLGLRTSRTLAAEAGGSLEIEAGEGRGATLRVVLPPA
jgi:signal transduction histidine kinase